MGSINRCAASFSCVTLLAPPDSAGGGLDRARVVIRRSVCFRFLFFKITMATSKFLLARTRTFQSGP